MRWIAIFDDSPAMPEVRRKYEAEHFAYLRANQRDILIAGPLRVGPDSPFAGSMWILADMNREQVVALIGKDPYYIHTGRGYTLRQWGKALQDITITL